MEKYERELTVREKKDMLDALFMDEEEYYEKFKAGMTEEQFQKFLKECPEFLEDMEEAKRESALRKQKKHRQ